MTVLRFIKGLVVVAALLGPLVAAYVITPAVVGEAWPLALIAAVPPSLVTIAGLIHVGYRTLDAASLPHSAAVWLKAELGRLGRPGLRVAAMARARDGRGSYFHPASLTIVLDDTVHGEHTVRAHAIAAHELGHALCELELGWLARLFGVARRWAGGWSTAAIGLAAAARLLGGGFLIGAAVAVAWGAMVLWALVVVDEAQASLRAQALLRPHLPDGAAAVASGHLTRALATYGAQLVGAAVVLALLVWYLGPAHPPLLPTSSPASWPIAAAGHVVAVSVLVLAGVAALSLVWRRALPFVLAQAASLPVRLWSPLLAMLVAVDHAAPTWAAGLALVPAVPVLTMPLALLGAWGQHFVQRDLDDHEAAGASSTRSMVQRITRADLARHEGDADLVDVLAVAAFAAWAVPAALWWLGLWP